MSPANNFAVIDAEVRKAIKEGKLYAGKHDSWKAYCEDISGFSRRRADQLITDVKERTALVEALGSNGNPVPLLNERITRELAQEPTPEAKAEIIQDVMKSGQPVNSSTVKKAREKRAKAKVIDAATGEPDAEPYSAIAKNAAVKPAMDAIERGILFKPEEDPAPGEPVQMEWNFIVRGEEDNIAVNAEATERGIEIGSSLDGNEREIITWEQLKAAMEHFQKRTE